MKNILILALVLAVLLGGYPVAAQQTNNDGDVYVVQPGDSAWRVAGKVMNDPTLWEEVVKKNPFLKEKDRITYDSNTGWFKVMMHPGEKLYGLRELGITGNSYSTIFERPVHRASWLDMSESDRLFLVTFLWMLLGFAIAALLWIIWRSRRDPVSSGPAIVPGGVTPEDAPRRFQDMAARLNAERTGSQVAPQDFQILSSRSGRAWGIWDVSYNNGSKQPHLLNGDRVYRAEVRFPDGKTETLYMLQGCGNDLRYGGISRYLPGPEFRFEADLEPVIAPPTVPVVPQEIDGPTILPTGEFVRSRPVTSRLTPQGELLDEPQAVEQPKVKVSEKLEVSVGGFQILKSGKGKPTAYVISGCIVGFEKRPDGSFLIREAE